MCKYSRHLYRTEIMKKGEKNTEIHKRCCKVRDKFMIKSFQCYMNPAPTGTSKIDIPTINP